MKTKEIEAIERKYGMMAFRMAFSHIFEKGWSSFQDKETIEQTCKEIEKTTSSQSIMSAEFQCWLLHCAGELAEFGIQDLLMYVKTNFEFDGLKITGEETKWKEYLVSLVQYLFSVNGTREAMEILDGDLQIPIEDLKELGAPLG